MTHPIQIPSASDRQVFDVFVKLQTMLGAPHFGGSLLGGISFAVNPSGEPDAALAVALEKDGTFIEGISVGIAGFSVL